MTDNRDARHARLLEQVPEEGCWAVCSWQGPSDAAEDALYVTPSGWAATADGILTSWDGTEGRIVTLLDPRPDWQPLPDGPTKAHIGRRVRLVGRDGPEVVGTLTKVEDGDCVRVSRWLFGVGTGDWYVEATDTDPDAAAIEAIITAYRSSPECSTHSVFGEAMLDLLRGEGWDLVKREAGESR